MPPDSKVDIFCNIYIKIMSIGEVIKISGIIVYNLSWKINKLILFDIDGTLSWIPLLIAESIWIFLPGFDEGLPTCKFFGIYNCITNLVYKI